VQVPSTVVESNVQRPSMVEVKAAEVVTIL
jgi:hypothetical protein